MSFRPTISTLFIVFVLLLVVAQVASACPVCYGNADASSPIIQGTNAAILTLLGITGSVLTGFLAFFVMLWRKAKKSRAEKSESVFVNEQGTLEWNNS